MPPANDSMVSIVWPGPAPFTASQVGDEICRVLRNLETVPANTASVPGRRSLAILNWLKNVQLISRLPSVTTTSVISLTLLGYLGRRSVTFLTSPRMVAFSPSCRLDRSVSLPCSVYRRG